MTSARVEIAVLSGGSLDPGLSFVAAAFQKETGHAVRIAYNMGAKGRKQMDEGVVFDVVTQPSNTLEKFFRATGKVEEGGISIGRVGMGVMVRPGAPLPDISSAEALKRAVLEAESIVHTTETSGRNIEGMLRKMGIYEQVQAKTRRFPHGPELMDGVLEGKGREFAFLSVNAILTYKEKGMVLVGPLPEEVQIYNEYIAVPSTMSPNKEVAWAFARFCGGPGKPLLVANGIS